MMNASNETIYRKGEDANLDKAYSRYKRMRPWSGGAVNVALTQQEANTLLKLWKKEKFKPRMLPVEDVQNLMNFASHIRFYRGRVKTEQARRRKERSTAKLRKVARSRDGEEIK